MELLHNVNLKILSPMSLLSPVAFRGVVADYCNLLPEVSPQKWGWYEPLKTPFVIDDFVVPDHTGPRQMYWKRSRPNAQGTFSTRWISNAAMLKDTHSSIRVFIEKILSEGSIVVYLKAATVKLKGDFALIDCLPESRMNLWRQAGAAHSSHINVVTHDLRNWVPDVFWANVYGPAYTRLFGLKSLMDSPVYLVEKLSPDSVYVQLTEKCSDTLEDSGRVDMIRDRVKAHLGVDAFFSPDRSLDYSEEARSSNIFRQPVPIKCSRVGDFILQP